MAKPYDLPCLSARVNYTKAMEAAVMIDPSINNGRPTIRGTRITAQTVLEFLGAGDSIEEILAEYPSLTREDILACLRYASRLTGHHFTVEKVA